MQQQEGDMSGLLPLDTSQSYDNLFEDPPLAELASKFDPRSPEESDQLLQVSPQAKESSFNEQRGKIFKNRKIRTCKNVHKTYHIILKHWMEGVGCARLVLKYEFYFNKRIYFILVLHEIMKQIDGPSFIASYQSLAEEVIQKKTGEIQKWSSLAVECEQNKHLIRVIDEIRYSVQACRAFMDGRILEAITIVYKRGQKKICKLKEFQQALEIFRVVAGYPAEDM